MTLPPLWRSEGFGERLDIWAEDQHPPDELVNVVLDRTFTRYDNPYAGVTRQPDFPNLWFGKIPGTIHGDFVVVCTYRIFEWDREVRCDGYATLRLPV